MNLSFYLSKFISILNNLLTIIHCKWWFVYFKLINNLIIRMLSSAQSNKIQYSLFNNYFDINKNIIDWCWGWEDKLDVTLYILVTFTSQLGPLSQLSIILIYIYIILFYPTGYNIMRNDTNFTMTWNKEIESFKTMMNVKFFFKSNHQMII